MLRFHTDNGLEGRREALADRGAGLDHAGRPCDAALLAVFACFEREIRGNACELGSLMPG
jgi:hypothetical protein